MKLSQAQELVNNSWIVKPGGFKVRFQQMKDGKLETDVLPTAEEKLFDSDVRAWRYAWKLSMAGKPAEEGISEGSMVNITVVDDKDQPVVYYATGKEQIFNPVP